jgi:LacI family transcriptional regulator
VSGPPDLPPSRDRVVGYLRALKEAGSAFASTTWCAATSPARAGSPLSSNCSLKRPPSAIFASNDLMAIGGICAASEARVRMPEQLSVIGYDDIALASFATPPLTTMAQPKYEMGQLSRACCSSGPRVRPQPAAAPRDAAHQAGGAPIHRAAGLKQYFV